MGYVNSMWAFGIPLGAIYWFWRLKRKSNKMPDEFEQGNSEIPGSLEEE